MRSLEDRAICLTAAIGAELGWCNTIALADGLRDTLAFIDADLDTLRSLSAEYLNEA